MSRFVHEQDDYGNDLWFGHAEMRMPALDYVHDYDKQVDILRDLQLRSDDVIVVGYPKSGLNWTHHISTMLVEGTTHVPELFRSDAFTWLDAVGWEKMLAPPDKPRVVLSHLPFRFLPRDVTEKKVKLLFVTRNPKDVFVSTFCFCKNFSSNMNYEGTWSQLFPIILNKKFWYGNIFDYLRDWEKAIDAHPELPILPVSFEDMKMDLVAQVERMNEFLGTGRSSEFCEDVAHTCRFSNMAASRTVADEALRSVKWKEAVPFSSFFRKGEVGDWKNWFTVAQNEEFEEVYRTKMAGSKLSFRFE